jgi:antitoxin component YwqK of YwqJK toxin-antitoxin module
MNAIDNYRIVYYSNGKIHYVREIDNPHKLSNGFLCQWYPDGKLQAMFTYEHGLKKGYGLISNLGKIKEGYFIRGTDISTKISHLVKDLSCITNEEKTLIALQTGIVL